MTLQLSETSPTTLRKGFEVHAVGLGRYDIQVSLPPGYADSDVRYPAIYVLDGNLFFETVHGWVNGAGDPMGALMIRCIVVGVGYPEDEGQASYYARRNFDFYGPWDMTDQAGQLLHVAFEQMKVAEGKPKLTIEAGGATRFMAFLRDELHPTIADRFRVDTDARHILIGDSSGGHFVLRAMFDPNSPFRRYVCISPAFGCAAGSIEQLETDYAAAHDDLDIEAYLCAGSMEMENLPHASGRAVSGVAWVREQFSIRGYPSARVTAEIQAGEHHGLNFPRAMGRGLNLLFQQDQKIEAVMESIKRTSVPT